MFDPALFEHLASAHGPSGDSFDDLETLHTVLELLDPAGRDFGTDVGDLVTACLEHGALRLEHPVTGLGIQPTLIGDTRDGGFLVLVTIADAITLTSDRTHTGDFAPHRAEAATLVLTVIAAVAVTLSENFRATATALLAAPPAGHAADDPAARSDASC